MGSTFVTKNRRGVNRMFGANKEPEKYYLQFVPGVVLDVANNQNSSMYTTKKRDLNSIIAHSHIQDSEGGIKAKSFSSKRYYPLLRGIQDVPMKGDPVLLCTIGSVNYYLGPLNTTGDIQYNPDHLGVVNEKFTKFNESKVKNTQLGLSKNYIRSDHVRLQKHFNDLLDDVEGRRPVVNEIIGDMILEGRYGNSIRFGSRDVYPLMMLSNGRPEGNSYEGTQDGSLLAFFTQGSLQQHFQKDVKLPKDFDPSEVQASQEVNEPDIFRLSSDTVADDKDESQKRMIGDIFNYDYYKSQAFLNSDKITLNSKKESMFLSSYQNIYLGAGLGCHIISEGETVIESSNIFLGKQAKIKKDDGGEVEPLVMGEQLRLFLIKILDTIGNVKVSGVQPGISGPIINKSEVEGLKNQLKSSQSSPFNSEYHFIEDNGNKPE
tara:strand:+ start:1464 stop:2762 length:1299 start_codon:yes stop_codon:yes gene_type:complete